MQWSQTNYLPEDIRNFFSQHAFKKDKILKYMQSIRKGKRVDSKSAENRYQVLEKYCIDMIKLAREGKLDPVIGRHEEIGVASRCCNPCCFRMCNPFP